MAYIPAGGVVKLTKTKRLAWGEVSRDPKLHKTKKGGYFITFSMVAGVDDKGEKVYIDCKTFLKGMVSYCKDLARGDPIAVLGELESREREGNTYWDLNIGWANSPNVVPDMGQAATALAESLDGGGDGPQFSEVEDEDGGELPF